MEDNQRGEHASSVHLTEYTDPMLHELSESIEKKEMVKSRSSNLEVTSIDMQKYSLVQLGIQEWDKNADFSQQWDQQANSFLQNALMTATRSFRRRRW